MKFMEDALAKVGSSAENASQIAEVIIDSELRGSPDHGLYFFKLVIDWHQDGTINPDPATEVIKDSAMTTIIEGDGGCVGACIAICDDRRRCGGAADLTTHSSTARRRLHPHRRRMLLR